MRLVKVARSAPVRHALVFAALSGLVTGALLILIYSWTTAMLERHLEEAIEAQVAVLRDDLSQDGRKSLIGLVRKHAERRDESRMHILLEDEAGRMLAGDLPAVDTTVGWRNIELPPLPEAANGRMRKLRALGAQLDDDLFVLVAHDTADTEQTQALLIRSFMIALFVMVALALVGGFIIATLLLRRVDDVNRTARAIMDGDLSRRIPTVQRSDELSGLAESLNRMLARIEDLMGDLRHVTSSIAHDLRSPLGRLRQRLETARFKPRSPSEYETAIDTAIADTDAILKTFDAMLRITQIESRIPRDRFVTVSLSDVCENVADAFTAVAEDDGKRLLTNIEPDVALHGDRELLMQMLVNLVENALRHTPRGTTVGVELKDPDGRPRLTISDDGPGILADEREHVFKRFYRLEASRTTPGSGLGLSFVMAVVKLHDATISLEDNSPGLRAVIVFC